MRKILFALTIMMILACPAMAARYRQQQVTIVDEFGDAVTDITSISIFNVGTTTATTIYSDRAGEITVTNPITPTSANSTFDANLGLVRWFQAKPTYKITLTDGSKVLTIDNQAEGDTRFPWYANYIGTLTSLSVGDNNDLIFGSDSDVVATWENANNILSWIPKSDGLTFDIGDSGASANMNFNVYVGTSLGLKIDESTPSFIWDGGAATINANSNFNTGINTGTSTGTITLGNSAAGAIVLDTTDTFTLTSDGAASITTTDAAADIVITATLGRTTIFGGENAADAILLEVDNNTASRMRVFNDTGTGASAATESDASIQIQSDVGGIGLLSGLNGDNSIRLEANGGANENIILHSNQGTGQDSVNFLSDVGGILVTASAVPDGQYGLEVSSAIAGGTASQGSAIYAHTTLTGNIDASTYNLGSWLDITSGTPTTNLSAGDFGIYVSATPTLSSANIYVLQVQYQGSSSSQASTAYMMRFNCLRSGSGGDDPDGWFQAGNPESVAMTENTVHTSASTDKVGAIKCNIVGYGDVYFYLYSSAGQ